MIDPALGVAFEDADVVDCYRHRPPYPPGITDRLISLAGKQARVLDLGCGPGKIAREVAPRVAGVTAVDPSANMIELGRTLPGGDASNIDWREASAEVVDLDGDYQLAVAGASLHWMDLDVLMPRLATCLTGSLAVVDGDGPHNPPWAPLWVAMLRRWLPLLTGRDYDESGHRAATNAYEEWLDFEGREVHSMRWRQPVSEFVACQHSRQTFARLIMGAERAHQFDRELAEMLAPHANRGMLTFDVQSTLTWGRIS